MSPSQQQIAVPHRLGYIDSLRGLAILLVILVHTHQSIPGQVISGKIASVGQMGVQLFFVVSAFTLSMNAPRPGEVASFYVRRYFRIAPLYYFALAFYAAWPSLLAAITGASQPSSGFDMTTVVENLSFVRVLDPRYISAGVPGGWSISTEFLFYLAFPAIFVAMAYLKRRSGNTALLITMAITCCLLVVSANLLAHAMSGLVPHSTINDGGWLYFSIPVQAPVFLVGITFYLITLGRLGQTRTRVDVIGLLVSSILASIAWNSSGDFIFSFMPIISAVGFAFLFRLIASHPKALSWLEPVGRCSYSLYIIHFVFAWDVTSRVVPFLNSILPPDITLLVCYAGSVAGSFALAVLMERWIERPGIALGRSIARRLKPSTATAIAPAA